MRGAQPLPRLVRSNVKTRIFSCTCRIRLRMEKISCTLLSLSSSNSAFHLDADPLDKSIVRFVASQSALLFRERQLDASLYDPYLFYCPGPSVVTLLQRMIDDSLQFDDGAWNAAGGVRRRRVGGTNALTDFDPAADAFVTQQNDWHRRLIGQRVGSPASSLPSTVLAPRCFSLHNSTIRRFFTHRHGVFLLKRSVLRVALAGAVDGLVLTYEAQSGLFGASSTANSNFAKCSAQITFKQQSGSALKSHRLNMPPLIRGLFSNGLARDAPSSASPSISNRDENKAKRALLQIDGSTFSMLSGSSDASAFAAFSFEHRDQLPFGASTNGTTNVKALPSPKSSFLSPPTVILQITPIDLSPNCFRICYGRKVPLGTDSGLEGTTEVCPTFGQSLQWPQQPFSMAASIPVAAPSSSSSSSTEAKLDEPLYVYLKAEPSFGPCSGTSVCETCDPIESQTNFYFHCEFRT